jgi:hypothetical protein
MEWVVNAAPRPLYPRERLGTHCIGGWVGPRADVEGAENVATAGIRSPDRPARSQLQYRLSYRAHTVQLTIFKYFLFCNFIQNFDR